LRGPQDHHHRPHGDEIEPGTSELCLAIAGYRPATLTVISGTGATYDYWMFEGLRPGDNGLLHVTSTHCDDGVATSLCARGRGTRWRCTAAPLRRPGCPRMPR